MSDLCHRAVEEAARQAIQQSFGTEEGEYGSTLFVSHHLEEVEDTYWKKHTGSKSPDSEEVLDLLECRFCTDGDGQLTGLDFSLPGDVSQYVLALSVDENGDLGEIEMES
ncbi:MAG: DUF2004 domain-containing protein [Planctomycetota bacterium]|nr:DUF2004 domain-containing protein [Planctomycetota bacterium]